MTGHVCTCGDCEAESFADRCRYEAEVERLRERIGKAAASYERNHPYGSGWDFLRRVREALSDADTQ